MKCGLIPIRNVDHKKEGVERLEAWDVDVDMAKGGESAEWNWGQMKK